MGGEEVLSIKEMARLIGKRLGKEPGFFATGKKIKDMVGTTDKLGRLFRPAVNFANGLSSTIAGVTNSQWILKEKCA